MRAHSRPVIRTVVRGDLVIANQDLTEINDISNFHQSTKAILSWVLDRYICWTSFFAFARDRMSSLTHSCSLSPSRRDEMLTFMRRYVSVAELERLKKLLMSINEEHLRHIDILINLFHHHNKSKLTRMSLLAAVLAIILENESWSQTMTNLSVGRWRRMKDIDKHSDTFLRRSWTAWTDSPRVEILIN